MEFTKEELLQALEDNYKGYEDLYDANCDKIAQLYDQIEGLKVINKKNHEKMKEIVSQIKKVKER